MEDIKCQESEKLMVWLGLIDATIIGPYFFEGNVTAESYLHMLQTFMIPNIHNLVPASTQRKMWFMQNGAPPHFGTTVRKFLDTQFPAKWIGSIRG